MSINVVIAIVIVVALVLILTLLQSNFAGNLENFGVLHIEGALDP